MCYDLRHMTPGSIVLDIDGTITHGVAPLGQKSVEFFSMLHAKGWSFLFVTGRAFSFAQRTLEGLPFPYILALQHGADILLMPEEKLLDQKYLSGETITSIESAYEGENEDFLIYSGVKEGDFCYYRPEKFSPLLQAYLQKVMKVSNKPWRPLPHFKDLFDLHFPLIKCIGEKGSILRIEERLKTLSAFEMVSIQDPLNKALYLLLITHKEASKGAALQRIFAKFSPKGPLIVAGDDYNDASMLDLADIKIVIETAPRDLQQKADIIARSPKDEGIIDALQQAIFS